MPFCGEANSENLSDFGKLPSTEILVTMENKNGDEQVLLGLLDSGPSRSLITSTAVTKATLPTKTNRQIHAYRTTIGMYRTDKYTTTIRKHKIVGWYDIIFGRDYSYEKVWY
jgi:hypothetical protein